ncbi:glycosyltransferase family 4 protein, partial [Litoricolaceae bacterium]|nr:glycosyltransferase family 4 protein [Litorivicinaceae bacterium]
LGVKVEVICEQVFGTPSAGIHVHTVTPDKSSSRWRAMLGFRARVESLIAKQFAAGETVIHSHERLLNHHVTTFHGPPMQVKTDWWRFSCLSPRIKAWKLMEKDEVLGPQVKFVLPVSDRIKNQLISLHPGIKNKRVVVAYPGIHKVSVKKTAVIRSKKTDARFVFVGKEWKRKGLRFAMTVIENYASRFEQCVLEIYGPSKSDLPANIGHHPNVVVKGWANEIPWDKYDALIHPATNEPFGMVIPEARSHGVPVLTTNIVGSTELNYCGVTVLCRSEPIEIWAENLRKITKIWQNRTPENKWTWQDLASQHANEIYPLVPIKSNHQDNPSYQHKLPNDIGRSED